MTAPTPLWFDDPTSYAPACGSSAQAEPQSVDAGVHQPRAGAPECPKCHTTEPPRLVTFDGIDSGTGEHVRDERHRCACGFVGEAEEFENPVVACGAKRHQDPCGYRPVAVSDRPAASATQLVVNGGENGGQPGQSDAHGPDAGGNPAKQGAPVVAVESRQSISPRIERGTDDGSSCPF